MITDPLWLTQFELQLENERERRFLATLSDQDRSFVEESDKLRAHLLSSLQCMLTETHAYLRRAHSEWVAEHAVDVAERQYVVRQMRIRFMKYDTLPMRVPT